LDPVHQSGSNGWGCALSGQVLAGSPLATATDAPMRISAWTILLPATFLATAPARAQMYNPDYPVCLQVYGIGGGYIACGYASLEQCAQSASGRAAQCIVNPYFVGARVPAGPHYRQHRHVRAIRRYGDLRTR
jgi:hypothetical protein